MVLQHNSLPQSLSFLTGPPLLTPQLAFCLALGLPTLKPFPGPRSERLSDFFPPGAAPSLAPPQPMPSHPRARPLTCSVARSGTPRSPPPDTVAGASCPAPASTVRMRLRRELCSSARASGGARRSAAQRVHWAPRGSGTGNGPWRLPSAWRKWVGVLPRACGRSDCRRGGKPGWLEDVDRAFSWGQFRRPGVGVNLAVSGPGWLGLRGRG